MKIKNKSALALATTVCMFCFYSPSYAEGLTPTLGDDSAYTLSIGSASDYSFITYENGQKKYYKINIKTDLTNNNSNLTWTKVTEAGENTVEVNVPHNGSMTTEYYKYTYTNVDDSAYVKQHNGYQGGAIYNNTTTENITADFAQNYAYSEDSSTDGGAIYNTSGNTIKK